LKLLHLEKYGPSLKIAIAQFFLHKISGLLKIENNGNKADITVNYLPFLNEDLRSLVKSASLVAILATNLTLFQYGIPI